MFPLCRAMCEAEKQQGGGLLIAAFSRYSRLVALSARHTCDSEHLTKKAHNKRSADKLFSPLSKPPSLFMLKTRGALASGCVSKSFHLICYIIKWLLLTVKPSLLYFQSLSCCFMYTALWVLFVPFVHDKTFALCLPPLCLVLTVSRHGQSNLSFSHNFTLLGS